MAANAVTPAKQSASIPNAAEPRPAPQYPFLFRWMHWVLVPAVVVLFLTGLSLHAGSRPGWSLLGGKVPAWFWTGRVHLWHAWAAMVFAPAILAVSWVYARQRVVVRPTHLVLLIAGLSTLLSGFLLANPPASEGLYAVSLWIHAIAGLAVVPVWFLWHTATGLTAYRRMLVPAFHPWRSPRVAPLLGFLVLAAVTSWVLIGAWPMRLPFRELVTGRISPREVTDMAALPWIEAQPLEIQLAGGSAFEAGRTRVTLRALHDGEELFVKAEWADDDANYDYWPWEKTRDGWRYMQTSVKDECRCYEDKFSLAFPIQPDGHFERFGCAMSCHLHGDYGWGYKASDRMLDVWHWKAARTDPAGQADDQYWFEADFNNKDIGRFTDPKQGGGYVQNRAEGKDHPLFLPDGPDAVFHGSFPKSRAVKYTDEAGAKIAAGTIVPGVITAPFQGDRGQVACKSQHRDGRWTLYLRRRLDTGCQYDTQFAPGGRYAFGCAAFDHAGKRHAHALPTYYLVLAE